MITIENIQRIINKSLGKKNFYIQSVNELVSETDGNPFYVFELTNRKWVTKVFLSRNPVLIQHENMYQLIGNRTEELLTIEQIKNMDIFMDKIRYVGIK